MLLLSAILVAACSPGRGGHATSRFQLCAGADLAHVSVLLLSAALVFLVQPGLSANARCACSLTGEAKLEAALESVPGPTRDPSYQPPASALEALEQRGGQAAAEDARWGWLALRAGSLVLKGANGPAHWQRCDSLVTASW